MPETLPEVLKSFALNVVYFALFLLGLGILLQKLSEYNSRVIMTAYGRVGSVVSSFIGTPVHEGSHALMCLLFGHRITEIKLFDLKNAGRQSGTLGYVKHSYNPRNIYQRIGNFFIGVAPLIGCTVAIILSLRLLLPESFANIREHMDIEAYIGYIREFHPGSALKLFLSDMGFFISELFLTKRLFTLRGLLFLFLCIQFSTHMSLSGPDIKTGLDGLAVLLAAVLLVGIAAALLGLSLWGIPELIIKFNVLAGFFLLLGIVFTCISILIGRLHTALFYRFRGL